MADPKTVTPAYVPFKTFTSVLDSFKSFLPDSIDTSMWPSYSGGTRSQLIGALRFLRLIDDNGIPTDFLHRLAAAPDQPKKAAIFVDVMKAAYGSLMALDLTKATPGSFDAEMRKFGQEGETHRKAASFFLQAAKWAGVPLSPLLLKKGSLSGSRRKRVSNGTNTAKTPASSFKLRGVTSEQMIQPVPGSSKEIVLSDGSRLFLKTEKDLFNMTTADRKFTMHLLEQIEAYEAEHLGESEGGEEEDQD